MLYLLLNKYNVVQNYKELISKSDNLDLITGVKSAQPDAVIVEASLTKFAFGLSSC